VRFLLDENQSPRLVALLSAGGHDVIHVRDVGLRTAPDIEILERARVEQRVVVSADTDFGELLAASNATVPSVLLIRRQRPRRASEVAALILANLDAVLEDLESGSIVVLDTTRVRVRRLPFRP
jgi:predicted nuclease of predicted toxin-antitoxin system